MGDTLFVARLVDVPRSSKKDERKNVGRIEKNEIKSAGAGLKLLNSRASTTQGYGYGAEMDALQGAGETSSPSRVGISLRTTMH